MKTSLGVAVNEAGSARRKNKPTTGGGGGGPAPTVGELKFNDALNSGLLVLLEDI